MKLTKILTLLVMVFTLAFAGFAQDSTKTEAPKVEKKHMMKGEKKAKKEKKEATGEKKATKKGKKAAKKADADTTKAQ